MTDIAALTVDHVEALLLALHRTRGFVVAAPNIRLVLRRLLVPALPQLTVLSVNEFLPELELLAVHQIGVISAV
jgi:flagellar biosynthesis component FlhA